MDAWAVRAQASTAFRVFFPFPLPFSCHRDGLPNIHPLNAPTRLVIGVVCSHILGVLERGRHLQAVAFACTCMPLDCVCLMCRKAPVCGWQSGGVHLECLYEVLENGIVNRCTRIQTVPVA